MFIFLKIHQEIAPQSKDLQGMKLQPSLNHAINASIGCLKTNSTWVQKEPSVRQTFCLDFVNSCCSRIQVVSGTLGWVEKYWYLIQQLGDIYYSCSGAKKMSLLVELPQHILDSPSNSVKQYFSWIQKIHNEFLLWNTKLDSNLANYDEIYAYTQNQHYIGGILQHVSAAGLVISAENLMDLNKTFLEKFEELNILLLKYVPGDYKHGW